MSTRFLQYRRLYELRFVMRLWKWHKSDLRVGYFYVSHSHPTEEVANLESAEWCFRVLRAPETSFSIPIGTKFKNFPLSIFWYYLEKKNYLLWHAHAFFWEYEIVIILPKWRLQILVFHFFFVIQRQFFKFDCNQLKDFFFVYQLLGTRKFFTTSGANTFFFVIFFCNFFTQMKFPSVCFSFSRTSETFFSNLILSNLNNFNLYII